MALSAPSRLDWGALLVIVGMLLFSALAWLWMAHESAAMAAMDGMWMPPTNWLSQQGLLAFGMWLAMMLAMMWPASLPVLLLYRRCLRTDRQRYLKLLLFGWGYALVWAGFALLFSALQAFGEWMGLLDSMRLQLPARVGAAALLLAGLYQLSQAKAACQMHCQAPLTFLQRHARSGLSGAFRLGLQHGLYCVGCCWALMLILLVLGAMSLWGMAILSVWVLVEKSVPLGSGWRRCTAGLLILASVPWFFWGAA